MYKINTGGKAILLTAIVAIGLASCHSTKNIVAPEVDTKGLFRDSAGNTTDTITVANIPWQEYFTDTKLQALIKEGLERNIDMQIAARRITQAEANLSITRGAILPSFSAVGDAVHNSFSSGADGTKVLGYHSNQYLLGFSASWEFNLWGKQNSLSRAKYASFLNSYAYKNLIQSTLIANIAKSYYSLLALDEQLRITKETVILLQASAETMLALKEAGQQNAAAVEQSNALLYNTQLSVFGLESMIYQQENAISVLLGRNPGAIDHATIDSQTVPAKLSYGVPMQLLAKRPDVLQAELSFRSAYELTNAAQASLYPTITIAASSATLGFSSSALSDFFKPENIAANFVAGISQPIFNRRLLKGNLKIAQSQQDEALLIFKNTVIEAGQEVSDILFEYQASIRKNEYRDKQIASLNMAVSYTQELLKAGEANYTEVLSAQQSLLAAQLSQINDKLDQLTYSVSLYKALGGGTN